MATTSTTSIIRGPGNLVLELDPAQIFPDNPGEGTPALVRKGSATGTFACALDTGELDCGDVLLTQRELNWLASCRERVESLLGQAMG